MIWFPYACMKNHKMPDLVTDAKGIYLHTKDCKLIDSISSWWTMIHGYRHERLNQAAIEQINKFSHVMLGSLVHQNAIDFSNMLAHALSDKLKHCFYSDSGSVGVEVALKIAYQYYKNQNITRHKILSLKNGYHGDTFMAMKVSDCPNFHGAYKDFNDPNIIHTSVNIDELKNTFLKHKDELYAFILEPMMQAAGGFKLYDLQFLKLARELCDEYNVILIFDEIATGFGRLGYDFISNLVHPDIVILGKALTGGYTGHSVCVANDKVFLAFNSDNYDHALMHGPTFMANPLALRLAIESMKIFYEDNYLQKVRHIEQFNINAFENFKAKYLKDIRIKGAMLCLELDDKSLACNYYQYAKEHGVFARTLGNCIYAMFPYIIDDHSLQIVANCMQGYVKGLNRT